jgi:hypothetical protein
MVGIHVLAALVYGRYRVRRVAAPSPAVLRRVSLPPFCLHYAVWVVRTVVSFVVRRFYADTWPLPAC